MAQQERATGAWHAEWEPQAELLRLAGGAAARTRDLLGAGGPPRPHAGQPGGDRRAAPTERVAAGLAGPRSRRRPGPGGPAQPRGRRRRPPLRDVLLADPRVQAHLDETEIDRLLDPAGYLGPAGQLVDRALAAHHARRTGNDAP